jgi:sugar lactone lactonase YvrE
MKSRAILFFLFAVIVSFFVFIRNVEGPGAGYEYSAALTPTPRPMDWLPDYRQIGKPEMKLPSGPPVRGVANDTWADVIIGQPAFGQITPNEVVANKLFNPGGVYVDRSVTPNRVYVYDAGNSRILGFLALGTAQGGPEAGQPCTSDSDHPGSVCIIDPNRNADLVIGQPSFTTSMCNGDSAMQSYPAFPTPSASTLCGLNPENVSILEGGSMITMAADGAGNLYVPDFLNNRVLRYNDPFNTDSVADFVWGQAGFTASGCNRGASFDHAANQSLCFAPPLGHGNLRVGVAVDSHGNVWVADAQNNRVLRFPFDAQTGAAAAVADLVLGQPNFTSSGFGQGLNQMGSPSAVRVDSSDNVYVADGEHFWTGTIGRVLIFHPPFSNGMSASQSVQNGISEPSSVELDPVNGFWVNDSDNSRILHFDPSGTLLGTISNVPSRVWGGIGVDRDSRVMLTGWDPQEVLVYAPPNYNSTTIFLTANQYGSFNQIGAHGVTDPNGLEVVGDQLIVADRSRLLFWNSFTGLTNNYPPADGVVGQPDFYTAPRWSPEFGRMRADTHGRLWVLKGDSNNTQVMAYPLPLTSGASPSITLSSPLPLKGGGTFSWSWSLMIGGIAYQPNCDCLWLSDRNNNRVFRIREVSTNPTVDIVLGQTDASGTHCNQGRDSDDGYIHPSFPTQDSLCAPGGLTFDPAGNLFVSDHTLELAGNWRLLEFDASALPDAPASTVYAIPATRVFGRGGSFTSSSCVGNDPICGPWEVAFDSNARMYIGFNGYLGPRFTFVYQDLMNNPLAFASLDDYYSHPYSIRYACGDVSVLDKTRNRVLIYRGGAPASQASSTAPSAAPTDIILTSSSVLENSPAGTAVGTFTSVDTDTCTTFTYSFCGGADDAQFQIAGNQLSTNVVFDYETKNSYSICVRSDDGNLGTFDKTIAISVLDAPGLELKLPANGAALHVLRPTFDWDDLAGVSSYQLQISKASSFGTLILNKTVSGSAYVAVSDLMPNTQYYWRVRGKSGLTYTAWSMAWTFTTGNPPSVPSLTAPANGALITTTSPLFDWGSSKVPAGTTFDHYQLQVATDLAFSSLAIDGNIAGAANSSYAGALLSNGATYYWRVRSFNTAGDSSAWSAVRSVKIKYSAPVLLAPANGATLGTLLPAFTWTAVPGAASYTLEVSRSTTFLTKAINVTVGAPNFTAVASLLPGTKYYWRVRVNGPYGPVPSLVFSFTTP